MLFVLIPLGLIALSGIVYLAVSQKSSAKVRIAAFGALGLMILAVIICIFVIFGGKTASEVPSLPDAPPSDLPPAPKTNVIPLIIFAIFLVVLFVVTLVLSHRQRHKPAGVNTKISGKDNW